MNIIKGQLENLYIEEGLTVRQCADVLGLPTSGAVSWAIKKYGIVTRAKGVPVGHKRGECTEVHRENLSKSHIGNAGFWTGKKRSPEDIEKFRKSHLGKKQSDETKQKRMESISGGNHYNWKGGITPLVRQTRRCFKYRQWRSEIFMRDNFTCILCGKKGDIEADHHPKSFSNIFNENEIKNIDQSLNCKELWNITNGRTLCQKCHDKNRKKSYSGEIIRIKYQVDNQQIAI